MATKRSYMDACAFSHALDLVGERWALLVVRELVLGPKRFTDLRAGLPGISPNVLSQRLTELEEHGVVRRRKLPPPASAWIYELTEWGLELEPIIVKVGRWAARSPGLFRGVPIGVDSLMLSFRTMFDGAKAGDMRATFALRFAEDVFHAEVADGVLTVERGDADRPDATVTSDSNTLASVVYGGQDADEAIAAGSLSVAGDHEAFAHFITLFPLPAPAQAAGVVHL